MSIAYDIDVKTLHDPYIIIAEAAAESISETTNAGSYLVDVIPICEYVPKRPRTAWLTISIVKYIPEWVPGAGFQKQARIWYDAVDKLRNAPYDNVLQRMVSFTSQVGHCQESCLGIPKPSGEVGDCAAKSLIEAFGKDTKNPEYTDYILRSTLGSLYVGQSHLRIT